jgi:hypothetical protein
MRAPGGIWLATGLWLTLAALPAGGQGVLWDGSHWARSSQDGKLGYLWGLSNLADLEVSAAAKAGTISAVSQAVRQEMQRATALELLQEVDRFYRENPDKTTTTVLEVLLRRHLPGALREGTPQP